MDPFQSLLTQPSAPSVAPEMLEMLGHKAAAMLTQEGVPLNDGIRQLIAQHPDLNNEHVRRVIEFANTKAFQEMFQNNQDKNVHFDVADPGVVIRDMKDGGSPSHDGKTLSESSGKKDYLSSPRTQGDLGDTQLTELFAPSQESTNSGPMAKVAAASEIEVPHASHANPVEDVYDTYVHLQATRDELTTRNDSAESMLKMAKEDLYKAVKHEVLRHDGAGLGGVVGALEKVASQEKIALVLPDIVHRLLGEGIHPHHLERSLIKIAGVVVNPHHPLITAWQLMEKAAEERQICTIALRDTDKALNESHRFLRSA
jgi:hypothetical protein